MRWDYDEDARDMFGSGVHRDILIVPHATNVVGVKNGPPTVTYKVPEFEYIKIGEKEDPKTHETIPIYQKQPVKDAITGEFVMDDVPWVINNRNIIKEKFKYSYSLNSDDNLSFTSCNAAMLQFTIRNEKEYNEEEGYWQPIIPNLQNYELIEKDPGGNEVRITGELEGNWCIKAYMYFNGDSSNIMYLGMFKVEEDKVVDNGYSREITAYDFMAWFRDIDVFNWYKHLFTGINKLDNDYEDMTNKDKKSSEKTSDYNDPENWVREPKDKWTIKEALEDLINNFAAYDNIVYEKVKDEELSTDEEIKYKYIAQIGNTVTNCSDYGRDDYEEGNGYSGLGMPIIIDSNILDKNAEPSTPTEPGPGNHEEYGYMKILELEFYQNPKIMKQESLSAGKFLEDIGVLAGRYPFIRTYDVVDEDYVDPTTIEPSQENEHPSRYNNFERCILSFKPLPSSKDDETSSGTTKLQPEQCFSNHEIVKGFQHDYYEVNDIEIIKIGMNDDTEIEYKRLTKSQRNDATKGLLQTFTFSNNLFCSYLVAKSDDKDIQDMLDKYKVIREKLFGTETKNHNMTANALFEQGYYNIKYRKYTPFQLTTYADPVRECGDRIKIDFEDKVTGEQTSFYTYILERTIDGIQKMMDTYTAKGDMNSPLFSNYQTGSKYQSGSSYNASTFGYNKTNGSSDGTGLTGITPNDLVEYWRNIGIRLLDEPSECSANFVSKANEVDIKGGIIYNSSTDRITEVIKDGDTTSKLTKNGTEVDVKVGDYFRNQRYVDGSDPAVPSVQYYDDPLYVYTLNGDWKLANNTNYFNMCGSAWVTEDDKSNSDNIMVFLDHDNNFPKVGTDAQGNPIDEITGTNYKLYIRPRKEADDVIWEYIYWSGYNWYSKYKIGTDTTNNFYAYGDEDINGAYERITEGSVIEPHYGDFATIIYMSVSADEYGVYENPSYGEYMYQYPGIWVEWYKYPDLDGEIHIGNKQYVALKWSDPEDITDYKPTPATWEGTVIVRKENSPPLHRWDGTKVVNNTTRDKYKTEAYKDEDIKMGRDYYYGFFPYYTKIQDPNHPIRYYRFTKVIKVNTGVISNAPVIDNAVADGTSATITYTIVSTDGVTYTNGKLYGKIGSNPSCDNTDDIVQDINIDGTSITLTGLEYDSTYYFCIQVNNNDDVISSNVKSCETEEDAHPWRGQEVAILWSGENNKMTAQVSNSHIVFKLYTNNTEIYSFNAYAGSTVADADNIYVGFLIDSGQEVAKPSMVYANGSVLSYNQESPTDAEMGDIYTWLSAGLPSE